MDSNQTPLTREIERNKAQILPLLGDFDRALECANSAYDPASSDYREHVWHGQLLNIWPAGPSGKAIKTSCRTLPRRPRTRSATACRIAPNAAECRVGLVQLLVATNQMKKARIAADDAQEMIPSLHRWRWDISTRPSARPQKAGQCYEKAVQPAGPAPGDPRLGRFLCPQPGFPARHSR